MCEQVVGRGLRRTSYEIDEESGLFAPEYVNIFGVPFTFIPHEGDAGLPPPPPKPRTPIEPEKKKQAYEISWPNIIRIDHVYNPCLTMDLEQVEPLVLDSIYVRQIAELAPIVEGHPDVTKISRIDLEDLAKKYRMQRIIFETARDVFDQMQPTWKGNKEFLLAQIIKLAESFLNSDKILIEPVLFNQDELTRRLVLILSMTQIVQHMWNAIRFQNTEKKVLVFDYERPIRSTADMRTWYTGKPCEYTDCSHINCCVYDSTWEASEAFELDRNKYVSAWVKNDHLGYEIPYVYQGAVHKYRPDFIIRLVDGSYLVVETKGRDTQKDKIKRSYLNEWVEAVNADGRFDKWQWAVSFHPKDIGKILENSVKG